MPLLPSLAEISIPEFWGKERNPIIYKDIDLDKLNVSNFKKVEEHKEGKVFKDRKEILKAGLHNNTVFGISQIQGIAKAVVLSGGYVDETYDRGEEVIYIGQGGRDEKTGKQTSNQSFENTFNKSLVFNCNWNIPVRVFRGSNLNSDYAPKNGYRYDGKYLINDFWYSQGVDGFKICLNKSKELGLVADFSQSNIEGEIVTLIQDSRKNFDGIIINAAGFTHTSVAIRDALSIFKKPIIELHISNIYKREEFRHKSLISDVVTGGIFGLGADGYILAIISMQKLLKNEN